jgi:hypothetical protein
VGKQFVAGEEQTVKVEREDVAKFGGKELRVYPMFGRPYTVEIPEAIGGHGGGDAVMLEQIFSPTPPVDPFNRAASHLDGAASILLGIAANTSMATGQPVNVDDLLKLPG